MRRLNKSTSVLVAILLSSALTPAFAAPRQSFLVGLKPGVNPHAVAGTDASLTHEFRNVNAIAVQATEQGLARLKAHRGVEYVERDHERTIMGFVDGTHTWGLDAVNAPEAWAAGATGAGIRVCILDTGIDYGHAEFANGIVKSSKNFVSDGHANAQDGNGHGTHVAGTIAGQLSASGSKIGVAPNVELHIGRVLGDTGSGSTSGILAGVNWCTDTVKAHIISMSLGGSMKSRTEENTYNSAYSKGVLVIAAAGNGGNNRLSYPAGYANVVSVAAVDANLAKASFSQYNSDVELAGPGVAVLSSVPRGTGQTASASENGVTYAGAALEFAPFGNVSGPVVSCGLGDSTSSCVGEPTSGNWIALVDRGVIAFSDKVNNVKAQGAKAVILANNDTALPNDAGSFTLGAAGSWLPTVSVSYNSGVAIKAGGLTTGNVTIGTWDYAKFDGTSMATPHVSAIAALAWSAKTTLTNAKMRTVLQTSVQDLGAAGRDTSFGYGLVLADKAVAKAKITQ